jgi:hypothetical protein
MTIGIIAGARKPQFIRRPRLITVTAGVPE